MKTRFRLPAVLNVLALSLLLVCGPSVGAVSPSGILMTEIQTTGVADAGAEFVRLVNQTTAAVSLEGWKLQYRSASGTSWTTRSVLSGELAAAGSLLVATAAYNSSEASQLMTSGLAQGGGHVQLVDSAGVVQDLVGWGGAIAAETAPTSAPVGDQSLLRIKVDDAYRDTDNNLADFELEVMPLPPPIPPPAPKPAGPSSQAFVSTPPGSNSGLLAPSITELLPNPAAPQTDADDEFVELYNPNGTPFTLTGYKLQTGANYTNSVNLKELSIPAYSYLIITSSESSLSLSNTAGGARLLDPEGVVIAETTGYDKAAAGMSWAVIDTVWQWSSQPTPGAANVAASPLPEEGSNKTSGSVQAAAQSKSAAKTSTRSQAANEDKAGKSPRIHLVIIALVACLAVAYAIYEYRYDIGNYIYKLRTYRARRRGFGQTPEGR